MLVLDRLSILRGGFRLNADLSIAAGSRVAVIGPSGAGKSTLLAAVAGFVAPKAGRVRWNGEDITGLTPGERPVSIVFQDNNLFPHLTVAQNVGLGISPGLRLSPADHHRIGHCLARVGLSGAQQRMPADLSGGQQSRVTLARAMLRDKPVLLLDEPFAALGPALKADMLGLVTDLTEAAGIMVLMVTHDPRDARQFADRTIMVADGIAAAPRDTAALFADPPAALRDYLG